jgi:hypothetical protein
MTHGRRCRAGALALGLLLGAAGCESTVEPSLEGRGNVEARIGATAEVTDTAVLVDGQAVVAFGDYNRSLWLEHQTLYEYGGIGSFQTDVLRAESWFFRFSHRNGPSAPDAPYIDHGTVQLQDTAFWRTESGPFIGYGATSYAHVDYLNGNQVTFVQAPHLASILRRDAMPVSSTGSAQASAFSAEFNPRRHFTLAGMRSGEELSFLFERPLVHASKGLELEFNHALQPGQLHFLLMPNRRVAGAAAWLRLREPASRIVIPPSVLTQLLAAYTGVTGEDSAEYVLLLSEYHTDRGVIRGRLLERDEDYALDFVQQNGLRMFLRLRP